MTDKAFQMVIQTKFFQTFVTLWSEHLKNNSPPGILANFFLETMVDPTEEGTASRKDCSFFVNVMASRSWSEMLKKMSPFLPDLLSGSSPFEGTNAEAFYLKLRTIIIGEITRYYDDHTEGLKKG